MSEVKADRYDMEDIRSYLEAVGSGPLMFCPNPGNAGDSAIALGTYHLLERMERPYEVVQWNEEFSSVGRVVVYGGGGNLGSPEYTEARQFLRRHFSGAKRLVLLPHTVRGHKDLLQHIAGHVDIFCRERVSYDWVRQHVPDDNVHLADDMAFGLEADTLLHRHGPTSSQLMCRIGRGVLERILDRILSWKPGTTGYQIRGRLGMVALSQLVRRAVLKKSVLPAMRTDVERTDQIIPPGNVDVSRVFEHGVFPPSRARTATVFLMAYLDQFEKIITNRLHIGIIGALLGKVTDLYPNSYYKNEAVYKFSIKDRYPSVNWKGK